MNNSTHNIKAKTPVVVICPGFHGHGIARSLGRLGIPVYGVHGSKKSPTASSRYWKENFFWDLKNEASSESVKWLMNLANHFDQKPILIPTDDLSGIFVDDYTEILSHSYIFPIRPTGLSRSLSNKEQLYHLCKKIGIPTPETAFPKSRKDVEDFISNSAFPVVLKGSDTEALQRRTGIKMLIIEDAETLLEKYLALNDPNEPGLMIQEFIPGGPEDVWMFNGYFDENSDCHFAITGRKLRQYPAYTGLTCLGICAENKAVSDLTKTFMKKIGYTGVLDIGYKYDARSGNYYLLDPNPRVGASFRLFVDSNGTDVVRALYRDLTGQKIPAGELQEGRKWMVEPFDMVSSLRYWRDGKLRFREWLKSFRGVEEAQWFASDDLRPFGAVWLRSLQWAAGNNPKKMTKVEQ